MSDPKPNDRHQPAPPPPGTRPPETTPAEERGERLDTGKTIARGGKTEEHVPGAEPAKDGG
jgi:hypothetical protein